MLSEETLSQFNYDGDPLELLIELASQKEKAFVSLGLFTGQNLQGILLSASSKRVLLADRQSSSSSHGIPCYISSRSIETVHLHNPEAFLKLLSSGRILRDPKLPVPSKLSLKRKVEALEKNLSLELKLDWSSLPEGPEVLHNLNDFLIGLETEWKRLQTNSEGKKALAGLKSLQLEWTQESPAKIQKSSSSSALLRWDPKQELNSETIQTLLNRIL